MNYAALPASPLLFTKLHAQRVRLAQWAFGAAVRLSDQNRPLALKLCIECMILARSLMLLLGSAPAPAAEGPVRRAAHRRPARAVAACRAVRRPPTASMAHEVPGRGCRRSARWRHSLAGRTPASVQQESPFLCMVGLHG